MLVEFEVAEVRWQQALKRARELMVNRVAFRWVMDKYAETEGRETFYLVTSATAEGEVYSVVVVEHHGDVAVNCTCKGAEFGKPCWHGAAALIRLGLHTPAPLPMVGDDRVVAVA